MLALKGGKGILSPRVRDIIGQVEIGVGTVVTEISVTIIMVVRKILICLIITGPTIRSIFVK